MICVLAVDGGDILAVDAINDGGDILAVDGLIAILAFSWGSTATATKVLGETGTLEYWENYDLKIN